MPDCALGDLGRKWTTRKCANAARGWDPSEANVAFETGRKGLDRCLQNSLPVARHRIFRGGEAVGAQFVSKS